MDERSDQRALLAGSRSGSSRTPGAGSRALSATFSCTISRRVVDAALAARSDRREDNGARRARGPRRCARWRRCCRRVQETPPEAGRSNGLPTRLPSGRTVALMSGAAVGDESFADDVVGPHDERKAGCPIPAATRSRQRVGRQSGEGRPAGWASRPRCRRTRRRSSRSRPTPRWES